ncbi:hypothetical protein [Paenibacillus gorillae]|uniref:hypothetical protein n=1 Tax=Paenibacillus gorillae TaxID=1243662 RepID=UPI0004B5142D|nr:hypothetical protein [Paenibacillus gorillae]
MTHIDGLGGSEFDPDDIPIRKLQLDPNFGLGADLKIVFDEFRRMIFTPIKLSEMRMQSFYFLTESLRKRYLNKINEIIGGAKDGFSTYD